MYLPQLPVHSLTHSNFLFVPRFGWTCNDSLSNVRTFVFAIMTLSNLCQHGLWWSTAPHSTSLQCQWRIHTEIHWVYQPVKWIKKTEKVYLWLFKQFCCVQPYNSESVGTNLRNHSLTGTQLLWKSYPRHRKEVNVTSRSYWSKFCIRDEHLYLLWNSRVLPSGCLFVSTLCNEPDFALFE